VLFEGSKYELYFFDFPNFTKFVVKYSIFELLAYSILKRDKKKIMDYEDGV
jgi:hypothetical protein